MKPWTINLALALCLTAMAPAAYAELSVANQAEQAYNNGEYDLAEDYYKMALGKVSKKQDQAYAFALRRLANCYYMAGKLPHAEKTYRQLIALDQILSGDESLPVAEDLQSLSRILRRQMRFEEAEATILRILAIRRKVLGDNDKLVSSAWLDLAVNHERQGKLTDAESAFVTSIAIRKQNEATDGRALGVAYHLYAQLLMKLQRYYEANRLERRARELNPIYNES